MARGRSWDGWIGRPLRAISALAAVSIAIVAAAADVGSAATEYDCGAGGKPDAATKRCSCPGGKVESSGADGVSHCIDAPKSTTKQVVPAKCPEGMVAVAGGSFTLGMRGDKATVAGFCLDRTEVTTDAFAGCVTKRLCAPANVIQTDRPTKMTPAMCNAELPGRGDHPVNCVSFLQATSYCRSIDRRLPTEEEWEWAARGGDKGWLYPWGNELPEATRLNACGSECVAKFTPLLGAMQSMAGFTDGYADTAPVGSFQAGAARSGAVDLAGNVWEWTSSKWSADSPDLVARGGAWDGYQGETFTAAFRRPTHSNTAGLPLGFRCAK